MHKIHTEYPNRITPIVNVEQILQIFIVQNIIVIYLQQLGIIYDYSLDIYKMYLDYCKIGKKSLLLPKVYNIYIYRLSGSKLIYRFWIRSQVFQLIFIKGLRTYVLSLKVYIKVMKKILIFVVVAAFIEYRQDPDLNQRCKILEPDPNCFDSDPHHNQVQVCKIPASCLLA